MSTLEMKDWNARDYADVFDLEDEFAQIPMGADPNGRDMTYAPASADRNERIKLAKEVKDRGICFPKSREARGSRQRGEIEVRE